LSRQLSSDANHQDC